MKNIFYILLLLPTIIFAQYPSNSGQKITLGEQTTADGLVWRGRTSDTVNLLTNKLDTSVYIVLDTATRAMWYYRASTTPKWTRLVDSLNNLQGQLSLTTKVTGTLPLGNGGTGSATQNFVDLTTNQSIGGAKTFTSAGTFNEVLIGKNTLTLGNGTTAANSSFSLLGVPNVSYTWSILNNSSGLSFSPSSPVLTLNGDTGAATFNSSVTATTGIFTNYASGGTTPADIDNNGQIVRTSSIELKKDITNIKYGLNEILQIKPINFNWKNEDKFGNENENGFIAEDVINIIPNVVGSDANGIFMSYNKLIPILTKAIQEQQALIKALEQRILILENK